MSENGNAYCRVCVWGAGGEKDKDLKTKNIIRNKDEHCITIKGLILQEDISF